MAILNWLMRVARYYAKFGLRGLGFLLKIKLSGNGIISIQPASYLHPIYIRNKTTDIYPFHQILISEEYKLKLSFAPTIIFDLGGNIGLASVYFKNCYPAAKIVAVEPELGNYELLKENTRNYNDITTYNCGIWNKSTHLLIEDSGLGNWGFSVKEIDQQTPNSIKAIGIAEIMSELKLEKIDILKIDIEGAEKELFEYGTEEWLPKVKVIIIELHDILKKGASKSFFNAINKYPYQIVLSGENIICYLDPTLFKESVSK